jgi:uncharacterized damage-inducible protein DinB
METDRLYLVTDQPGFSPNIGRLVSMLNYSRFTTIHAVRELSVDQLDQCPTGFENSIGSLLSHFAATESIYQIITFRDRAPTDAEENAWPELNEVARRTSGLALEHYLNQLEQIRKVTLAELALRDDAWLDAELAFKPGVNRHWCWFHTLEDEINHRGQIRLIRKNLSL